MRGNATRISRNPAATTTASRSWERIKDRLNELTEDQREAVAEQKWFRDALPNVADADGINGLLDRAKQAGTVCKGLLHKRAEELGLHFDKANGEYAERQQEAA